MTRPEWVETQTRLGIIEHDLSDVKTQLRELERTVNERFDRQTTAMNQRLDRQSEIFDARFDSLAACLDRQTRWSVGLIALFGTMITMLVGIGRLWP